MPCSVAARPRRSFARFVCGRRTLVATQFVTAAAVSLVRAQVLGRVAERHVRRELALDADVERAGNTVTAAPRVAPARLRRNNIFVANNSRIKSNLFCSEHITLIVGVTRPSHFCLSVLGFCPCPVFLFIWTMLPAIKRSFVR